MLPVVKEQKFDTGIILYLQLIKVLLNMQNLSISSEPSPGTMDWAKVGLVQAVDDD